MFYVPPVRARAAAYKTPCLAGIEKDFAAPHAMHETVQSHYDLLLLESPLRPGDYVEYTPGLPTAYSAVAHYHSSSQMTVVVATVPAMHR